MELPAQKRYRVKFWQKDSEDTSVYKNPTCALVEEYADKKKPIIYRTNCTQQYWRHTKLLPYSKVLSYLKEKKL